jgi:hypothetical protein
MNADEKREHDRLKALDETQHDEKEHQDAELHELDAAERAGQVLTGAQRGRLADLRQADTLSKVSAMLRPDKKDKK